jgi:repressor LexA
MLEVAKLVGVSEATISRYESGNIKNMRRDRIEKYAKALQVSPSEFLDIQEEPKISKIPYTEEGTVLVPLIGKVAAGYCCHAEDNISEYIRTDRSSLKTGYDYFWLEVKGDSMEPELHEKDLVLVQEQDILNSNCLAVVTVDNEDGLVKQVQIDNTKITLKSINPYYPPRVFEKQDMNRIKIVGRVIEIKRRLV